MTDLRAAALSAIDCPSGDRDPVTTLRAHFQLSHQFAAAVMHQLRREQLVHRTESGWHLTAAGRALSPRRSHAIIR